MYIRHCHGEPFRQVVSWCIHKHPMIFLNQEYKILNLCLALQLGRGHCHILTAHQADAYIQQQASRPPALMAPMSEPGNKRRLSGTITNLPDELLSQILRHVGFATKLQGHEVCHQWNKVLKNPCRADLWGKIHWTKMQSTLLKDERRQQILQSTDWLARRAAGISHVTFETSHSYEQTAPQNSEARFFMETQLPYLLGHMHHHGRQTNISLLTGQSLVSLGIADNVCKVCQRQKMPRSTQIAER